MDDELNTIPHVLAFDIGNTAVHFAHVQGEEVTPVQSIRVGELTTLGEAVDALWQQIPEPRHIVAASVNPAALKAVEAAVDEHLRQPVLLVGRDIPLPLKTDLTNPESTGTDRICAAAAAFDRIGSGCVVADFGTAATIDYVSDEAVFCGGAIFPGLRMGARSLGAETAQLPEVEDIREPDWVFGKNTQQAITGGLVFAARGALRELVEAYATEAGNWPTVVCTGGDAALIAGDIGESDLVQCIVPDLAIRGVAIAYYRTLIK